MRCRACEASRARARHQTRAVVAATRSRSRGAPRSPGGPVGGSSRRVVQAGPPGGGTAGGGWRWRAWGVLLEGVGGLPRPGRGGFSPRGRGLRVRGEDRGGNHVAGRGGAQKARQAGGGWPGGAGGVGGGRFPPRRGGIPGG